MAQADIFMKIDDVQGESTDSSHKNEIEVSAWSWGAAQAGSSHSGPGAGSGKVVVQDLSFTYAADKSVPTLFGMVFKGTPFKKAQLTCRKAGGSPVEYIKIIMSSGLVSNVHVAGADTVSATVTLNFGKVEIDYTTQNADGSPGPEVTTQYNIAGHS
jgi:type VI secretion system secreted protein Hcp